MSSRNLLFTYYSTNYLLQIVPEEILQPFVPGRDGEQYDVYDAEEVARVDDEDELPRGHLVARLHRDRERHGHEQENPDGVVSVRVIARVDEPLLSVCCAVIK